MHGLHVGLELDDFVPVKYYNLGYSSRSGHRKDRIVHLHFLVSVE